MRQYKQLLAHDPANGVYGDCFRAAIACLLDILPESVPHFLEDGNVGEGIPRAQAYLKRKGLRLVEIPFVVNGEDSINDLESVMLGAKSYMGGIHHMLIGESGNGHNHVVICKDGQIVWDPAMDDAGIIGPADDGFFWVGFLAAAT